MRALKNLCGLVWAIYSPALLAQVKVVSIVVFYEYNMQTMTKYGCQTPRSACARQTQEGLLSAI